MNCFKCLTAAATLFCLSAGCIFAEPAPSAATRTSSLTLCNGLWTNGPCEGAQEKSIRGVSAATLKRKKKAKSHKPGSSAGKKSFNSKASKGKATDTDKIRRALVRQRPEPELFWKEKKVATKPGFIQFRVKMKLKGAGKVQTKLGIRGSQWSNKTPKIHVLPNYGGEAEWEEVFWLPLGHTWIITAKNTGSFKGYRSLEGCCEGSAKAPLCDEKSGRVMCGKKEPSSLCFSCEA